MTRKSFSLPNPFFDEEDIDEEGMELMKKGWNLHLTHNLDIEIYIVCCMAAWVDTAEDVENNGLSVNVQASRSYGNDARNRKRGLEKKAHSF